jgi:hypothetical protein
MPAKTKTRRPVLPDAFPAYVADAVTAMEGLTRLPFWRVEHREETDTNRRNISEAGVDSLEEARAMLDQLKAAHPTHTHWGIRRFETWVLEFREPSDS